MKFWRQIAAVMALAGLCGCSSSGQRSAEFQVPAGQYAKAFDESRDALTGYRFTLERVDAAAGVIATSPKGTAGMGTPWDQEQTTSEQDLADLVNKQQRTVRITFEGPAGTTDVRAAAGPVNGRVEVVIERIRRSGWRLDTTSVRYGSFTQDPALVERGLWPRYAVATEQDPLLAGRLAAEIRKRLGIPEPVTGRVVEPSAQRKPAVKGAEPGL